MRKGWRHLTTILLLWLAIFLGRLGEAQLKFDALLYGALAKHMLLGGDWFTPHYSSTAYANWFPHPPGMLWLAAIFFKVFGLSTAAARVLPSLFALGTLLLVYYWGRLLGSRWLGLMAALVLVTSTRYVKYGSDLVLDGPLAFFLVAGSLCFLRATRERPRWPWVVAFGLCGASAFVIKGLIAAALFGATLLYAGLCAAIPRRGAEAAGRSSLLLWVGGVLCAVVFVSPWPLFAHGDTYLAHYWKESVAYRLQAESWWAHFAALENLVRTYWPWLPVLLWGLARAAIRLARGFDGPLALALLNCAVILAGFTYSGHFLEHYLVPFYPFAALIAALTFETVGEAWQGKVERGLRGLAVLALAFLAVWPHPVRARRDEPIRDAAIFAAKRCASSSVTQVVYTAALSEQWLGLAAVLWETPWDAVWAVTSPGPVAGRLLLAAASEAPAPGWERVDGAEREPFVAYRPRGSTVCP